MNSHATYINAMRIQEIYCLYHVFGLKQSVTEIMLKILYKLRTYAENYWNDYHEI